MNKIHPLTSLLLSINRALLGEITPNIRGITYALNDSTIIIRCYFEGQITEENSESMDCVATEVIAAASRICDRYLVSDNKYA